MFNLLSQKHNAINCLFKTILWKPGLIQSLCHFDWGDSMVLPGRSRSILYLCFIYTRWTESYQAWFLQNQVWSREPSLFSTGDKDEAVFHDPIHSMWPSWADLGQFWPSILSYAAAADKASPNIVSFGYW